jgi:hypothetical protein
MIQKNSRRLIWRKGKLDTSLHNSLSIWVQTKTKEMVLLHDNALTHWSLLGHEKSLCMMMWCHCTLLIMNHYDFYKKGHWLSCLHSKTSPSMACDASSTTAFSWPQICNLYLLTWTQACLNIVTSSDLVEVQNVDWNVSNNCIYIFILLALISTVIPDLDTWSFRQL